ncbi:MAG: barstar family protein [Planctomycetia bacterium]|nr:barstar family protein [Planctomycetia bacterium]
MTADAIPPEDLPPFVFLADPNTVVAQATVGDVIVRIPIGITRQQSLFRCFAHALRFPGYFGWNWDALRNCLLDLTWLDPVPHRIVIIHDEMPFASGQRELGIYLRILGEAASSSGQPPFQIVFPKHQAIHFRHEWQNNL